MLSRCEELSEGADARQRSIDISDAAKKYLKWKSTMAPTGSATGSAKTVWLYNKGVCAYFNYSGVDPELAGARKGFTSIEEATKYYNKKGTSGWEIWVDKVLYKWSDEPWDWMQFAALIIRTFRGTCTMSRKSLWTHGQPSWCTIPTTAAVAKRHQRAQL
jgi:hypothetical protein